MKKAVFLLLLAAGVSALHAQEKRNSRAASDGKPKTPAAAPVKYVPVYFYEFARPGFIYSHIKIEHDEKGQGRIWFKRDGEAEFIDDPIDLSPAAIEKLQAAYKALNFLDSDESYQTKLDHSNMGNITIIERRNGRERKAEFNWTENKDAKVLMDMYRAISNEYTWRFEILSSRDNQPLLSPGLMDVLDRYIQRGEIADPQHIVPFLTELSTDERLPLMARNHAATLIKRIRKSK